MGSDQSAVKLSHNLNRAVVIAMIAMWMMQAAVHNVVNVIAMGHRFVATVRAVNVLIAVAVTCAVCVAIAITACHAAARFVGLAAIGVGGVHIECVLAYMITVLVVQMAIVQIVHMIVVFDGGMATAWAMFVCVVGMYITRHFISP